jgi:hypothetical protein
MKVADHPAHGNYFGVRDSASAERIANETALRAIYPTYPVMGGIRQHPRGRESSWQDVLTRRLTGRFSLKYG